MKPDNNWSLLVLSVLLVQLLTPVIACFGSLKNWDVTSEDSTRIQFSENNDEGNLNTNFQAGKGEDDYAYYYLDEEDSGAEEVSLQEYDSDEYEYDDQAEPSKSKSEKSEKSEKTKSKKSEKTKSKSKSSEKSAKKSQFTKSASHRAGTQAAVAILENMDFYDLANVKVSTFKKLDPEALTGLDDVKGRIPLELLSDGRTVDEATQAEGIAELLNSMPQESVEKIGPGWLDILPLMPDQSWSLLDDQVIEGIPWQGVVANLDSSVWGQMSDAAYVRFPDKFYKYVPMDVWTQIPADTWAGMDVDKIKLIREPFLAELIAAGKFDSLSSSQLRAIGLSRRS